MSSERAYALRDIWVYGVGGVGGYFGGKLACGAAVQPERGQRIHFVARGDHFRAIRERGLTLNTEEKDGIRCVPHQVTDRPELLPPPDLCLLCVKSYDLDLALRSLVNSVKDTTLIVPLLNGVDIYERVRSVLRTGIVLPACAYVGTHIEEAGTVTQRGAQGVILCGNDPGRKGFNPKPIVTLFADANIQFTWADDPFPAIWEKFIFIAAFGLVTAYAEKTLGEVAADPALRELVEKIMGEIVAVGARRGITLSRDMVEQSIAKAGRFPFGTKTSYQRDVESKGERNEGDLFGGTIIRMGKAEGIPTPFTESLYAEIERRILNSNR